MDTFPSEIISLILAHLPAKSILQCRCVRKSWLLIIDNPQFAETHLSNATQDSSTFILLTDLRDGIYVAQADQESQIIKARKVDICIKDPLVLCASCDGLVCMSSGLHKKNKEMNCITYVFNPCTRMGVRLPIYNSPECSIAALILGFGLDALSKKYKLVQVFHQIGDHSYDKQEVQVYTLGSNSWRNVGYAPDVQFTFGFSAFVSGSCHWLAKDSAGSRIIVSFDLGREVFGVIPSPEFSVHSDSGSVTLRIVKLGGRLSVVDCSFEDRIEIWILKKYAMKKSWIKHFVKKGDINLITQYWHRSCYPLSISKNGDILLVCDTDNWVYYNTGSGKCTPLETDKSIFFGVLSHVESLISL